MAWDNSSELVAVRGIVAERIIAAGDTTGLVQDGVLIVVAAGGTFGLRRTGVIDRATYKEKDESEAKI